MEKASILGTVGEGATVAAIAHRDRIDSEAVELFQITNPDWAQAIGQDAFGLWCEIALERKEGPPVMQRLRWIAPGRFHMGAPEDEPGRWDDEGPRHWVSLSHGFWLCDTPCTQAVWEAVMGDNPSRFKSPDRPVERISWKDVQTFLEAARDRGLALCLPTEAQWEYACRAGTETALYSGPMESLGVTVTPSLDPIGWYAGNSGVDFDRGNGMDAAASLEKEFPKNRGGTRAVAKKRPNAWGLYDMLGNVWEWCADGYRPYEDSDAVDPIGPSGSGTRRVLRGGSWSSSARSVRCAVRSRREPEDRDDNLGFRCALVEE